MQPWLHQLLLYTTASLLYKRGWRFFYRWIRSCSLANQPESLSTWKLKHTAAQSTHPNKPNIHPQPTSHSNNSSTHLVSEFKTMFFLELRGQDWGHLHWDNPWYPQQDLWHNSPVLFRVPNQLGTMTKETPMSPSRYLYPRLWLLSN